MAEFLRTLFDSAPFFVSAFSFIGRIISTPLREVVDDIPVLYDLLDIFYGLLSKVPVISDIWRAIFGVDHPLDLSILHAMTTAVFGLILYRIIKWFLDIVL